jgi:hypothetical protein
VGHGFIYALDFSWKLAGWLPAILSVLLLELAALEYARPFLNLTLIKALYGINIAVALAVTVFTIYHVDFKFVELHSAYGMLLMFLPLHVLIYKRSRHPGSRYMMYSVLILISTLLVFRIPIVLHTYFNHLDLAHMIICVTVLLMWRGTVLYGESNDYTHTA